MDADTKAKGLTNTTCRGDVINAREQMDADTKAKGLTNTTCQGDVINECRTDHATKCSTEYSNNYGHIQQFDKDLYSRYVQYYTEC